MFNRHKATAIQMIFQVSILPVLLLISVMEPILQIDSTKIQLLLASYVLVASLGMAFSVINGFRPMSFIFYLFLVCWTGIPVTWQIASRVGIWGDAEIFRHDDLVARGLVFNLAVLVVFFVFERLTTKRRRTAGQNEDRGHRYSIGAIRENYLVTLAAGLVLLSPITIALAGGLKGFFVSRNDRAQILGDQGLSFAESGGAILGLVKILPGCLAVAVCVLAIYSIKSSIRSRMRVKGVVVIVLIVGLLAAAVFVNPLSNSRFISFSALGAILLAIWQPTRVGQGILLSCVGLFGLIFIYPLANIFRFSGTGTSPNVMSGNFSSGDYDGFQQLLNAIIFREQNPPTYGSHLLGGLFFFIPRALWSQKPVPASIDVAENRGYWFTNLSLPLHGELLIEFGVVGALVMIALIAILWSKIDSRWIVNFSYPSSAFIPYVAMAQFALLRGPIGSLAPVYVTTTVLIIIGITRGRNPRFSDSAIVKSKVRN